MNRWKCGSNFSPVADLTSWSVHQREPRNSTWSRFISKLREPSLMNHKLTSVCPASSPTVVVTVTNVGVALSEKEASIPSSSRHSLRAVAAGCSSGSTWPPGGRKRPAFTWSTRKTSEFSRSRMTTYDTRWRFGRAGFDRRKTSSVLSSHRKVSAMCSDSTTSSGVTLATRSCTTATESRTGLSLPDRGHRRPAPVRRINVTMKG